MLEGQRSKPPRLSCLTQQRRPLCLQAIFSTAPSQEHKEFGDLVNFLAQAREREYHCLVLPLAVTMPACLTRCTSPLRCLHPQVQSSYPADLRDLPGDVCTLLDSHAQVLAPPLRRSLAQAVILLHNRGAIQVRHDIVCFRPSCLR